ncbi:MULTISPECIES: hypothetical protein [unclassified Streptomyces]|uniref:hypothetical protein n=1 Tax=unclassified Streptomyces TaxID=2593676 RepID=UPI0036F03BF2
MSTPPRPGKVVSVRVDQALADDLATLTAAGMTTSDAVRFAVRRLAQAHRFIEQQEQRPELMCIPARFLYGQGDQDV